MKAIMIGLVAALALSGCAAAGSGGGKTYHGPNFTARLPETVQFCTNKPPAPDHGFVALLHSTDCLHDDRLSRMELIIGGTPVRPTDTPESIVGTVCYTGQAKPAGFSNGNTPVYTCIDDGEIAGLAYRQYYLLRKDAAGQAIGPVLIAYAFSTRATLAADATVAEEVMAGIEWR